MNFSQNTNKYILINKHYSNEEQYKYWKDGYIKIPINFEKEENKLFLKLKYLYETRQNFFLKKKYTNSQQFDFNGKIEDYDFCIEFLKKLKLVEKLKFISCSDLVMTNITIRINQNFRNTDSFWGGHRDTSFKLNKSLKGNVPPLKHLIYYPNLNNFPDKENQLKIWVGSHHRMHNGIYDDIFSIFEKKKIVRSDNDSMIFFNGSIKHAIGYTRNPKGNLRLIFSFLDIRQIYSGMEHFDKIQKWNDVLNND